VVGGALGATHALDVPDDVQYRSESARARSLVPGEAPQRIAEPNCTRPGSPSQQVPETHNAPRPAPIGRRTKLQGGRTMMFDLESRVVDDPWAGGKKGSPIRPRVRARPQPFCNQRVPSWSSTAIPPPRARGGAAPSGRVCYAGLAKDHPGREKPAMGLVPVLIPSKKAMARCACRGSSSVRSTSSGPRMASTSLYQGQPSRAPARVLNWAAGACFSVFLARGDIGPWRRVYRRQRGRPTILKLHLPLPAQTWTTSTRSRTATSSIASALVLHNRLIRRNSLSGSKKNIQATRMTSGNDFYSLWLDRSMTYSSALFADSAAET